MNISSGQFFRHSRVVDLIASAIILIGLLVVSTQCQQQKPASKTEVPDDVIRVSTELVQTSVTVVNKNGKFVDGLHLEDFEISVDGKPQPISFFELVKSNETKSKSGPGKTSPSPTSIDEETAGRNLIVFIDDLHLSPESIVRTRKMLEHYVDQQMGDNDQAAIASTSGQIGFLQQFTDSKDALRAAVSRLKYRAATVRDTDRPPMSEYQAFMIEEGDEDVLDHFVSILLGDLFSGLRRSNAAVARTSAEQMVRTRARRILTQSTSVNRATLATLENLMRSSAQLPGRKLVVLVSDGFLLNNQDLNIADKLREITDAAVRAGVVIYSIQASGLNTAFPDASSMEVLDPDFGTGRAPAGEDSAMQAPLVELAADTGGRALLNRNDLDGAIRRALDETSEYYLLAWRPEADMIRERKFHRIEVSLKSHPDLFARIHRGFFSEVAAPSSSAARTNVTANESSPQEQLRTAISAVYHQSPLQTYMTVDYIEGNGGPTLMILTQTPLVGDKESDNGRAIDLAGVVLDDQGNTVGSFTDRAAAPGPTPKDASAQRSVNSVSHVAIKPGLYQVRVAERDSLNGYVGRATSWIEVPDLSSGQLSLSSLLIGERDSADAAPQTDPSVIPRAQLKIDNRFTRNSRLRLLTYIYNAAARGTNNSTPQLEVQIQLLRHNNVLISSPTRPLEIKGSDDLSKLPFAEELSMAYLTSGRYILRVTVADRLGKRSASREAVFRVE